MIVCRLHSTPRLAWFHSKPCLPNLTRLITCNYIRGQNLAHCKMTYMQMCSKTAQWNSFCKCWRARSSSCSCVCSSLVSSTLACGTSTRWLPSEYPQKTQRLFATIKLTKEADKICHDAILAPPPWKTQTTNQITQLKWEELTYDCIPIFIFIN